MTTEKQASKKPTRRIRRVEAPECRYCGSSETFIYKTVNRMRYWKCKKCGDTGTIAAPPARQSADKTAIAVDSVQER